MECGYLLIFNVCMDVSILEHIHTLKGEMMKKKVTFLFILIPLICGALYLYSFLSETKVPDSEKVTVKTTSDEQTISQDGLSSMDYRGKVEDYQVKLDNEECISGNEMTSGKISYSILSYYASKEISEDVKKNMNDSDYASLKKLYTENTFTEEGRIEGDCSYLYIEFDVKCVDKEISMFTPLTFNLLEIEDSIATDYYGVGYETAKLIAETDEANLIDYKKTISPFKVGDSCSFVLVFIVPDDAIEENNICVNYGFGKYGKQLISDKTQEYMKLDLTNK